MSSTIDFTLIRDPQLIDLIDEEWAQDRLPDDDINLPANLQLEVDVEEEQKAKEPEKWLELGLQSVG